MIAKSVLVLHDVGGRRELSCKKPFHKWLLWQVKEAICDHFWKNVLYDIRTFLKKPSKRCLNGAETARI